MHIVFLPISFSFPGSQKSTKSPVITTPLSLKKEMRNAKARYSVHMYRDEKKP